MRPLIGDEEAMAVADAVRSGWVAQGPRVAAFEEAFANSVGAAHGVATSSCTTALHLALHLLGIGPGDEVVVPSLSFIATANAARYVGATPVFADVEPDTGNLSPETIRSVLTPRTRAIIVVHQGGVPADVRAIRAMVDPIPVIEDAACAAGSTAYGRPVGSGALLATWSFHPRKLITTGEGGMITTDNPEWAARLRRLREHGMSMSAAERHAAGGVVLEQYEETGFNYRMTDIQAAMGLVQLRRLPEIVVRRRALAVRYRAMLDEHSLYSVGDSHCGTTNFQSFWVLLPSSAPSQREVLAKLADAGIAARRGIMAAHLEPAYAGAPHGPLPVTEHVSGRSIILPMHHDLTDADQRLVVDTLAAAVCSHVERMAVR